MFGKVRLAWQRKALIETMWVGLGGGGVSSLLNVSSNLDDPILLHFVWTTMAIDSECRHGAKPPSRNVLNYLSLVIVPREYSTVPTGDSSRGGYPQQCHGGEIGRDS